MSTTRIAAAVFVAALASTACDAPATSHVIMNAHTSAPAYGDVPFPTDAVRDGDHLGAIAGLDAWSVRHGELVAAHLAALDGFGLRPLVEFPRPLCHSSLQHLVPILRYPHHVVLDIKNRMGTSPIFRHLSILQHCG